ncbi:FAD-binding oxidoreductase [Isoptericola halotolerans]
MRRWVVAGALTGTLLLSLVTWDRYSGAPTTARECTAETRTIAFDATHGLRPTDHAPPEAPGFLTQVGGVVNDASCLNEVAVHGVAGPRSEADVVTALAYARERELVVSPSGTRHAMGGQASFPGGLVLDMRRLDHVHLDTAAGTVRVGAGATWRSVLEALHPHGRAVAAMPSIDILSVGGTVSANAHGVDFRRGSLAGTVRSLRLVTADGQVRAIDRESDPELFGAVIGGYGLLGVITEIELETVPNTVYRLDQRVVPAADLADIYSAEIVPDDSVRMMYAHLSTAPSSYLGEAILYTYTEHGEWAEPIPPLVEVQDSRPGRFVLNLARHGGPLQEVRWKVQKDVLPRHRPCATSRNEALREAEACFVPRTQAMYNDLGILRHKLSRTDILQEYFLPGERLEEFLAAVAPVLREHDAELLSASVRAVHDDDTLLRYAPDDRLAVVLYLSQQVSDEANADMADLTEQLVQLALDHAGTFYLPYQQHYTRAQVAQAYPMLDEFFSVKRRHDPAGMFRNAFSERFA